MAFHPRKLLLTEAFNPDKNLKFEKKYVTCYLCYSGCPKECNQYFPPPSPPPQKHEMSIILILMLCVLGVIFFFLFYLTFFKYRSIVRTSRRRAMDPQDENFSHDEDQRSVIDHPIWYIRTIGLPKTVIDSISMFKYKKGEGLIEGSECSVCLNEFQENEGLRLLPKCSHAFHVPCIDTWLSSHKNCPICRAPIVIITNSDSKVSLQESSSSSLESREDNQMERNESRSGLNFNERNGGIRVLSDLVDHNRVKFDRELEIVRRSVSMDFGSMIYYKNMEFVEKLDLNVKGKRVRKNSSICGLMKSSSSRCLLQKRSISMKRSFSFSVMRKHSRSQDSIPANL